jgi:hypothetical protein
MDYLKQFSKDFWDSQIPIHDFYCSLKPKKISDDSRVSQDVITDLNDYCKPISSSLLPIAKQIVTSDRSITIKLPRIGDLLIGIAHQPVISNVAFILHNYRESIVIEGSLRQLGDVSMWVFSQLPVPLISVNDYDSIYLEAQIDLTSQYNLQTSNQDTFKAYYGYFSQPIQYQIVRQTIYDIPLYADLEKSLSIVCGIWTIKCLKNSSELSHDPTCQPLESEDKSIAF